MTTQPILKRLLIKQLFKDGANLHVILFIYTVYS